MLWRPATAHPNTMHSNAKPAVKSAIESAVVAALAGATCLWFLISVANMDEVDGAKATLWGLGLAVCVIAHISFVGVALKHAGRRVLPWLLGMVILFPVVSVVAMVLLLQDEQVG
ncbi:hypothetical protein [Paucibacter soli]|uniref:hypothetical protein n=1 Tax=Paucibacter soli TaxID=3133433 RepID=UPI0030B6C152